MFSVFNYETKKFDYYEAPGTSSTYGARGTKYRPLSQAPSGPPSSGLGGSGGGIGLIGFAPEALGISLPRDARRVGSGNLAQGVVANRGSRGSGASLASYNGPVGAVTLGHFSLGDAAVEPTTSAPIVVKDPGISFGKVIGAACIASIVGVIVQRALK